MGARVADCEGGVSEVEIKVGQVWEVDPAKFPRERGRLMEVIAKGRIKCIAWPGREGYVGEEFPLGGEYLRAYCRLLRRIDAPAPDWRAAFPLGCQVEWTGPTGLAFRERVVQHASAGALGDTIIAGGYGFTKDAAISVRLRRVDAPAPALAWPELPADDWRQRYPEGARVQCRFGSVDWCPGTVHGLLDAYLLEVVDDKSGRSIPWMCHENVRPLVSAQGAITSERVVEAAVPAAPPKPTTWTCPLCRGQHAAAAALAEHYLPCGWAWTQWEPDSVTYEASSNPREKAWYACIASRPTGARSHPTREGAVLAWRAAAIAAIRKSVGL